MAPCDVAHGRAAPGVICGSNVILRATSKRVRLRLGRGGTSGELAERYRRPPVYITLKLKQEKRGLRGDVEAASEGSTNVWCGTCTEYASPSGACRAEAVRPPQVLCMSDDA